MFNPIFGHLCSLHIHLTWWISKVPFKFFEVGFSLYKPEFSRLNPVLGKSTQQKPTEIPRIQPIQVWYIFTYTTLPMKNPLLYLHLP